MTTCKITKRINRAEIYTKYGIQYKAGKILSPLGWIEPLLKQGNTKTGKEVYTYSTLPTNKVFDTIYGPVKGTCPCWCEACYATKGNYNFPSVINALALQTVLARQYLDFVKRAIIAQLETLPEVKEIRIHAAGDFFSDEYFNMWCEIVSLFPEKFFWTYTKVRKYEKGFDSFENANIVKSIIDGVGFNFGHVEYILSTYKKLKAAGFRVYICKCGVDKNQHCHNCHSCSKFDFVLFIEHSTGYKPEESPLWSELVALVMSQD